MLQALNLRVAVNDLPASPALDASQPGSMASPAATPSLVLQVTLLPRQSHKLTNKSQEQSLQLQFQFTQAIEAHRLRLSCKLTLGFN